MYTKLSKYLEEINADASDFSKLRSLFPNLSTITFMGSHKDSEFNTKITSAAKYLAKKFPELIITSGAGGGAMEAANLGAYQAKELSAGFGLDLENEPHNNPYISKELNFKFQNFVIRKFCLIYFSAAIIICPGGYGTLDELFEVLTLISTKTIAPIPIILYPGEFYSKLIDLDVMYKHKFISQEDKELIKYCETEEEIYEIIKQNISN